MKTLVSLVIFYAISVLPFAQAAKEIPVKVPTQSGGNTKTAEAASTPSLPLKKGSIEFFAIGKPSMLKIHGESSQMTGSLARSVDHLTGQMSVPLNSFTTGMKTRDDHLKERVFETAKYDSAVLTITDLKIPAAQGEFKNLAFTGLLKLHGIEKEVKGTASVNAGSGSTSFTAHVEVKLSDFQIPPPEFMGMSMQDDVKIDAKGST